MQNDLPFHVSFAAGLKRLIAFSIAFRTTQLRTSPISMESTDIAKIIVTSNKVFNVGTPYVFVTAANLRWNADPRFGNRCAMRFLPMPYVRLLSERPDRAQRATSSETWIPFLGGPESCMHQCLHAS